MWRPERVPSITLPVDLAAQRAQIASATEPLGLRLTPRMLDQLQAYLALLQRWNATYNLTALRDPAQMLTHHLFDCLAVVPALRRWASERSDATIAPSLLDVGSGGGLPGAVIAIVEPSWAVTCIDAVGKKTAFVRQVAAELALPNLHATHSRVEQLTGRFDLVTSRAFATLAEFAELTQALLAVDGVWVAMKAKLSVDERTAVPENVDLFHVEQLRIPGLDAERCLVWMRPRG